MKTGKYTIREFFCDSGLNSVIVPEIQRDYVWGEYQVNQFLKSLYEDFSKYNDFSFSLTEKSISPEILDNFKSYYRKSQCSANIGFIYAYTDQEADGHYFLIDGQQRFTTVFLTLLVLASLNDDGKSKFRRTFICRDSQMPKLDYRVRENSHKFLSKLTLAAIAPGNFGFDDIKQQSWYLNEYSDDRTICSIISNIGIIRKFIADNNLGGTEFMEYLMNYIDFWYFDTSISEQGEDLYIFMNARGESMQSHENLKADLIGKLSSPEEKQEAGKEWEKWQDLFWKERGRNSNADKGFNEFLKCISGLEYYEKGLTQDSNYGKDGFLKDVLAKYGIMKDVLSIEIIRNYINAINILKNKELATALKGSNYKYVDWIDKAIMEVWDIFNNQTTDWFVSLSNDKRSTEHQRMTFIWCILKYIVKWQLENKDDVIKLVRTLRLFYVRYHNNDRAVETSLTQIPELVKNGPWAEKALRNGEETAKYTYLRDRDDIPEVEQLIWEIEDHPLNLDGKDVGAINCSHLITFDENPDRNKLEKIKNTFNTIFNQKDDKSLLNNLLFQSLFASESKAFWDVGGPWYYRKLDFSSWKRIIRGKGVEDNTVFKDYFDSMMQNGNPTNCTKDDVEKLMAKNGDVKESVSEQNILYALCWYAAVKGTSIWGEGKYITFNYDGEEPDKNFPGVKIIRNFKGDYHGGSPKVLSEL